MKNNNFIEIAKDKKKDNIKKIIIDYYNDDDINIIETLKSNYAIYDKNKIRKYDKIVFLKGKYVFYTFKNYNNLEDIKMYAFDPYSWGKSNIKDLSKIECEAYAEYIFNINTLDEELNNEKLFDYWYKII